jgi:murein DD-endopeptidase MepM/ murein hydrolase activator NlpD
MRSLSFAVSLAALLLAVPRGAPAAEPPPGAKATSLAAPRATPGAPPPGAPAPVLAVEENGLAAGDTTALALPPTAEAPFAIGVWPAAPFQGAVVVVDVAAPGIHDARGKFAGQALRFYRLDRGTLRGIAPVLNDAPAGPAALALEVELGAGAARRQVSREIPLGVAAVGFERDELHVDPRFTQLSREAKRQIAADRRRLAALWKRGSPERPLFRENFLKPREDRTTAPYGTRRTFNGKVRSVHAGWDIGGEIGAPVRCANDGVVRLARDLYYSGGTLIVDHGAGIYSVYFHLSGFLVKEGQRVKRGEPCARVGQSGRVTGPHLHFGAKVGGNYVHPEALLRFDFARPLALFPGGAPPRPAVPVSGTK